MVINTGIVTQMEDIGRYLIPIEIRRNLGIKLGERARFGVSLDGEDIVLTYGENLGITRAIDELGRIVIPSKVRSFLDIECGTLIELYVEDNKLILRKYEPINKCTFCGRSDNDTVLVKYDGKFICQCCKNNIAKL